MFADRSHRGSLTSLVLLVWFGEERNPKNRERESHPFVNLQKKRLLQHPWNCVKLRFVSCTSNFFTHMFGFRKMHRILLMLTSSLQVPPANQSLETILICNVVLCLPLNNFACIHLCDECEMLVPPKSTSLMRIFPSQIDVLFLACQFYIVHKHRQE